MSAGNVPWQGWTQYPDINHSTSIEDPGQSWNGLTVGACTDLTYLDIQRWPTYALIAQGGALSPASTTSDRKSTRLNSSHSQISYAVFCLKKKNERIQHQL